MSEMKETRKIKMATLDNSPSSFAGESWSTWATAVNKTPSGKQRLIFLSESEALLSSIQLTIEVY